MSKPTILVVDPILRGSRLAFSAHALRGFVARGWDAHLLTRKEPPTPHYEELVSGVAHQAHRTLPIAPDVWYEKLSSTGLRTCMDEVARLAAEHRFAAAFFSGWDEFFPRLVIARWHSPGPLAWLQTLAVDYSPAFWLADPGPGLRSGSIAALAKRFVSRLALRRFRTLRFLLLDERVFEPGTMLPAGFRDRFAWIPDPGPVLSAIPPAASSPAGRPTILLVGLQSKRKGLADVVRLLETGALKREVHFRLVGRLAPDTERLRPRLHRLSPSAFSWVEDFLPEADIQREYAAAQFVALPYTRSFDCSSSILAMASGHGKPVVATDHGVIGFRVQKHGLGFTYPSHDIAKLAATIGSLPATSSALYRTFSENCRRFAQANSVAAFQQRLFELATASRASEQP
jgi:glycosyltransferase involved in cell wall biosynthesis